MIWAGAAFMVIVGIAVIAARRPLASLQEMTIGGTMPAGCVIAEGVVLLLIGVLLAIAHVSGFLE